jgi:uncharacterized protein YndB with AHSA1/START domain
MNTKKWEARMTENMMNEKSNLSLLAFASASTRRQMIAGSIVALGGLATGSTVVWAEPQKTMEEMPSSGDKSIALHHEVDFKATPARIYEALLDSKQFSAFSLFGGQILGRNVELVPNQRIVQAWRSAGWDQGVYSIAKFELKAQGPATHLIFDHRGFPEGKKEHLEEGWREHYWERLQKYLG